MLKRVAVMDMEKFYLQINDPPVFFMAQSEADNLVYSLQCDPNNGAVRVIRGWKCLTYQALHNEVAAALQFPGYYGENWDAMDECITDLEWLSADWYLLHVSSIEQVLPNDEKNFDTFMRILSEAGKSWGDPEMRGVADAEYAIRKPFNVIISGNEKGLLRAKKVLGFV